MPIIDAGIYNALAQPQKSAFDYANEATDNALRRQVLQQQVSQNALTAQQSQALNAQRVGFRNAIQGGQIDITTPEGQGRAISMFPDVAPGAINSVQAGIKAQADAGKTRADTGKIDWETRSAKADKAIVDISSLQNRQQALASMNAHLQAGDIDEVKFAQLAGTLPQNDDPTAFQNWQRQMVQGILSAKERAAALTPDIKFENTGGQLVPVNSNANAGPVGQVAPGVKVTVSPNTVYTQGQENARAAAQRSTQLQVAGIDPKNPNAPGEAAGLSPAAIENAANRYNIDGTLPPMAMGPRGAVGRTAILNRAAELAVGTDPKQLRVNQLDAKSASSALTQLSRAQTMIGSFEDMANKNAEIALSLSKQNDRTGIPLVNAGLQAWKTGTGSPEASQFAAATETFVNEYAKVMSGGTGAAGTTDSMRAKASSLLSVSQTPQQFEGNVRLLQREMANRMKSFDETASQLKSRIGGGATAAPPAAANAPSGSLGSIPPDVQAALDKYKGK